MWHGAHLECMGSWVQFLLQPKGKPNGQTAEVPGIGDFQKMSQQTNINISEEIIYFTLLALTLNKDTKFNRKLAFETNTSFYEAAIYNNLVF